MEGGIKLYELECPDMFSCFVFLFWKVLSTLLKMTKIDVACRYAKQFKFISFLNIALKEYLSF